MTHERWQRIEAVFMEAEAVPSAERSAVLDRLCEGDSDLRDEIEQLLASDGSGTLIQSAIRNDAAGFLAERAAGQERDERQERFGHYQLVRRIGSGGMGAVYEANRVDDFHKKVALKIIKQEFDSDFARARFQQERQLLASLEHPYIGRLLDGGESEDGSPYLVLEFVDGERIDQYCAKLDRQARLNLFLKVCEAVDYAHRNLIIHRDLKPANILVTANGDPKLLDFGIAKLMDPGASVTQTGVHALTPDYASPEQVNGDPITTASDVYSLGVILYQLLTDRKPYTLESATLLEMERIICLRAPEPPGLGDELDHILMMALRKEPQRRYGSARQFAEDIQRYLAHQPVAARPDTAWYRARKYARRHWGVLLTASVALVGVLASAGVAVHQARLARRQFEQVRQLANRFLFEIDDQVANTPGTVKVREAIVSTSLEYLNRLAADAGGDPGLQWEIARAYGKVASAQGGNSGPSLSHPREAAASLQKALSLARPLADRNLLDVKQREALNDMFCDAASSYRVLRDYDAAARLGREAVSRSNGLGPAAKEKALTEMAATLNQMGDLEGSAQAFEKMMPVARENAQRDPSWENRLHVGNLLGNFGLAQHRLTQFAEAEAAESEALRVFQELAAQRPGSAIIQRSIHVALMRQGDILGAPDRPSIGKAQEAVAAYQQSIAVMEPLIKDDPNDLNSRVDAGLSNDKIAYVLRDIDPLKALTYAKRARELLDAGAPDSAAYRTQPRIFAAGAYLTMKEFSEADRLLREASQILNQSEPNTVVDLDLAWARLEAARGNISSAAGWFEHAIALNEQLYRRTTTPFYAWDLAVTLEQAANALPASAPEFRRRILAVWNDQNQRYPGHPYIQQRIADAVLKLR